MIGASAPLASLFDLRGISVGCRLSLLLPTKGLRCVLKLPQLMQRQSLWRPEK